MHTSLWKDPVAKQLPILCVQQWALTFACSFTCRWVASSACLHDVMCYIGGQMFDCKGLRKHAAERDWEWSSVISSSKRWNTTFMKWQTQKQTISNTFHPELGFNVDDPDLVWKVSEVKTRWCLNWSWVGHHWLQRAILCAIDQRLLIMFGID